MMFDTIQSILNGERHPLHHDNCLPAHIYRQYLETTETVVPTFPFLYNVNFRHLGFAPYKAKYYFRLIHNEITDCLNYYHKEAQTKPTPDSVIYWHYGLNRLVAEYITHFHQLTYFHPITLLEVINQQDFRRDGDSKTYPLICYYAIAMLAVCYLQWLYIFREFLPVEMMRPATPEEFIFDVLQTNLPEEIYISSIEPPKSQAKYPKDKHQKSTDFFPTKTFIYQCGNQLDSYRRLTILYQYLIKEVKVTKRKNPKSFLEPDTQLDDFLQLFNGERNNVVLVWTGSKQDLFYFIKYMQKRELITIPKGTTIWTITENHFSDKRGKVFSELRNQHYPKQSASAIEQLVDILDPKATTSSQLDQMNRRLGA